MILDGAPEPLQPWPTSLELAVTPAIDALCAAGETGLLATTPPGFAPGSETGVAFLLGALPSAPIGRGGVEAAAAGAEVPDGCDAWRLDLRHEDGRRATGHEVRMRWPLLRANLPWFRIVPLGGHRVLAIGARRPALRCCGGLDVTVWPDGALPDRALDGSTTMVCGPGAAGGIARLAGASVCVPDGATGDVDSDLDAKAAAALLALERGDDVVVHVGGADEAAHRGERDAKRAAIEAADARLVGPLRSAARRAGATLAVTSDHGTCPWTGRHDDAPVPFVVAGPGVPARGARRLSERALTGAPVAVSPWPAAPAAAAAPQGAAT